jgi:CDP-paratose 2-epimerase
MRVLITGGAGMVGSHAAEYYAKRNADVVVLDNLARSRLIGYGRPSVEHNWNHLKRYRRIRRIRGDVRSVRDVRSAVGGGVDLCIHAAAQSSAAVSRRMPLEDFGINALGTVNVLEALRQRSKDAVFIYCSTGMVYGLSADRIGVVEKDGRYGYAGVKGVTEGMAADPACQTPYGAGKYAGDVYAQEYACAYGMRTAVFRMGSTYGIRQFGTEEDGWAAHFVISNLLARPVTVYGDGRQVRDLLYVEDFVTACDSFFASRIGHGVYNIGGGQENSVSLIEFIGMVEKNTGNKMRCALRDPRPFDRKVYISDISKVSGELGWAPRVSPSYGVKLLTEWVKDNIRIF